MQVDKRKVHLEAIPIEPQSSLAVRHFRLDYFPFLWHCHPEVELIMFVQGSGLRFVGNSVETFEAGDLFLLGSNLPHSWQSEPENGSVHSIVAQFKDNFWGQPFLQLPEMRGVRILLTDICTRGVQVVGATAADVARLMLQIGSVDIAPLSLLLLLIQALSTIADNPQDQRLLSTESIGHSVHDPAIDAVNHAIEILNESVGDVLPSQSEIAARVSMTPSTFSRVFRRCVGKNYMDYLNEWRVGLACRALLETDDPIVDVSLAAGFENLSNFHRRFRERKGMTPTQWRAKVRGFTGERHLRMQDTHAQAG